MKTQLLGMLIAFSLFYVAMKTDLLPRSTGIILALTFLVFFRWLTRRSTKAAKERRKQELEELRRRPILHLDD